MRSLNIRGKRRKNEQYHSYKGEVGKIAENILNRDFTASKPFEKLTTDVTQFKVCNDKVYLSPVMDLYNREIVSYSISLSPDLAQIREMLQGLDRQAARRSNANLSLRPRLAVPTCRIPKVFKRTQHHSKHVQERELYGQRSNGELFRAAES